MGSDKKYVSYTKMHGTLFLQKHTNLKKNVIWILVGGKKDVKAKLDFLKTIFI